MPTILNVPKNTRKSIVNCMFTPVLYKNLVHRSSNLILAPTFFTLGFFRTSIILSATEELQGKEKVSEPFRQTEQQTISAPGVSGFKQLACDEGVEKCRSPLPSVCKIGHDAQTTYDPV